MEPFYSKESNFILDNFQQPEAFTQFDIYDQDINMQPYHSINTIQDNILQDQQPEVSIHKQIDKTISNAQEIMRSMEDVLKNLKQIQNVVDMSLRDKGLSQSQIQKLISKSNDQHSSSSKSQLNSKKKQKDKQVWSIAEHSQLLDLIAKYGKDNIKIISELMDQRTEAQVRSHLQKYNNKLEGAISEIQKQLNADKSINEFCSKYKQIEDNKKDIELQLFLQKLKQKFFRGQPPITTDIISVAMKTLRSQYPDLLFKDCIPKPFIGAQDEIQTAIAGNKIQNTSQMYIFVYPDFNQSTKDLNIKETASNFKTTNCSMSSITEQKKMSANYSFNCNFVIQQCYEVLKQQINQLTFKDMIQVVLFIEKQIEKVGDTFEYSIKMQSRNSNKDIDLVKLFMFCLRCALSV